MKALVEAFGLAAFLVIYLVWFIHHTEAARVAGKVGVGPLPLIVLFGSIFGFWLFNKLAHRSRN